jgi:hypothetical protein
MSEYKALPDMSLATVEVKTAAGVTLETPKLSDITGEEGLKTMVEPLQWTIDDINHQISTAKTWGRRRKLTRKLKTYMEVLSCVNGVTISRETTASLLAYAAKEAEDARYNAFVILTEGKVDPTAASEAEPDYDVFSSPEKMQTEFAAVVKQALVWENVTLFSPNPNVASTK